MIINQDHHKSLHCAPLAILTREKRFVHVGRSTCNFMILKQIFKELLNYMAAVIMYSARYYQRCLERYIFQIIWTD